MKVKKIEFRDKIHIYYSHKGKVLRKSTGIKVRDQYKKDNQKIIIGLYQRIEKIITEYAKENGVFPSVSFVNGQLKTEELQDPTVVELMERFIAYKRTTSIRATSLPVYGNLLTGIKEFEADKFKYPIKPEDINEEMLNKFQMFLSLKRDLNSNTIKKRIKHFKEFLFYASKKGYIELSDELKKYRSVKKYDPYFETLTKKELNQLLRIKLSGMKEKIRDEFVFMSLTGLRYSDFIGLSKNHIDEDRIVKTAVKTGNEFKVPLSRKAREIWEKYNYDFPIYAGPVFNRTIKDVLKEMKPFQVEVMVKRETYNKIKETPKVRWRLCSAHTARRTFVTIALLEGISVPVVSTWVGHSKIDTLNAYFDKLKDALPSDKEKINFL